MKGKWPGVTAADEFTEILPARGAALEAGLDLLTWAATARERRA